MAFRYGFWPTAVTFPGQLALGSVEDLMLILWCHLVFCHAYALDGNMAPKFSPELARVALAKAEADLRRDFKTRYSQAQLVEIQRRVSDVRYRTAAEGGEKRIPAETTTA
jgi:hypothetical protein